MLNALATRGPDKVHRYVEIENAGHCPNHEAPQAVGQVVTSWVNSQCRSEGGLRLVKSDGDVFTELWGETRASELREGDIELDLLDRLAVTFV